MSSFDDYFSRYGFPTLQQSHGQPIVYTPYRQSPISVTAVVGPVDAESSTGNDGRLIGRTRDVEIALADVPHPTDLDLLQIDGEPWNVRSVLGRSAGKFRLLVVRPERAEVSQKPYRLQRP